MTLVDLDPDMITVAKALSGGYVPVGALLCRSDVFDRVFDHMERAVVHSSTFGENDLGMVAGLATLRVLDDEGLVERAAATGDAFMSALEPLVEKFELVRAVRGKGLMIGIDLVEPRTKTPNPAAAAAVMEQTKAEGLLIGKGGLYGNVLRVAPPLSLTLDEAAEGLDILVKAIDAVSKNKPFFSQAIAEVLLEEHLQELKAKGLQDSFDLLTNREKEILQLLAEGRSNKEVAHLLNLSTLTVETHRSNLMQKLNLHNTAEIVLYAVRKKIIS